MSLGDEHGHPRNPRIAAMLNRRGSEPLHALQERAVPLFDAIADLPALRSRSDLQVLVTVRDPKGEVQCSRLYGKDALSPDKVPTLADVMGMLDAGILILLQGLANMLAELPPDSSAARRWEALAIERIQEARRASRWRGGTG